MKTLTQLQVLGYRVEHKIRLERGGPYDNERAVPLQLPAEGGARRFIRNELTQLAGHGIPQSGQDAAREAVARGDVVLLCAEDFASEPTISRFEEREGELRRGGPGGYPYRAREFRTLDARPLTQFIRDATGFPNATWAIKPQTGSWPDAPELYVFVPVAEGGAVSERDANDLVFGKIGDKAARGKPAEGTVRVEDDAVFIGGIRLDRRHGYVIQVNPATP